MDAAGTLELEKIVVKIVADAQVYDKVLVSSLSNMQQFANSLESIGKKMTATITAPLVAMGTLSANSFMKYEAGLVGIAGAANLSQEQVERMSVAAHKLSKELNMSSTEILGTFDALIRGGATLETVLGGAGKAAAQLARVGEVSTNVASETIVKILNIFNKDGLDAAKSVNILSAAADASVISIGDMIQSISQGGASAAAAGQSFRDFSVAIAMLGQRGIIGGEAGTAMRTFFRVLTSSEGMAKLKEFNVEVLDAQGNVKGLREIIAQLSAAFKDMPSGEKARVLSEIFGAFGFNIAANLSDLGVEGFDAMSKSMDEALTVGEKYEMLADTLLGAWNKFKAGMERVAISVGAALKGPLANVAELVTSMANSFGELDPSTQRFIVNMGLLAAATGPVLWGLGKVLNIAMKLPGAWVNFGWKLHTMADFALQGLVHLERGLLRFTDVAVKGFHKFEKAIYAAAEGMAVMSRAGFAVSAKAAISGIASGVSSLAALLTGPFAIAALAAGAAISTIALAFQEANMRSEFLADMAKRMEEIKGNAQGIADAFKESTSALDRVQQKLNTMLPGREDAQKESDMAARLSSGQTPEQMAAADAKKMVAKEFGDMMEAHQKYKKALAQAEKDLEEAKAMDVGGNAETEALYKEALNTYVQIRDQWDAAILQRKQAEQEAYKALVQVYTAERIAVEMAQDVMQKFIEGAPATTRKEQIEEDSRINNILKKADVQGFKVFEKMFEQEEKWEKEQDRIIDALNKKIMDTQDPKKMPAGDLLVKGTQEAALRELSALTAKANKPELEAAKEQLREAKRMNRTLERIDTNIKKTRQLEAANIV